jgi:glycosyltransferase involved in cell wall biosynthesis
LKKLEANTPDALLVADAAGHILERIGETWRQYARHVQFELALSERDSIGDCCTQGQRLGFIHWLDRHRGARAASCSPCPQAVTVYHYLPGEEDAMRELASQCDVITTGAKSWQQKLQQLTGKPVVLTPQSVDTEFYKPVTDRSSRRLQAGIPEDIFLIGFVAKAGANVQDRKGTGVFCELIRQVRLTRRVGVMLVGQGWTVLATELRQSCIQVWSQSYVHWREARAAYALMDVLVVTAKEEGGPATVMEAMASGVPVVTSPVGHVPEIVIDGHNGLVCPADDVAGYVRALRRLDADASFSHGLTKAARETMVQNLDDRRVIPLIDFEALQAAARVNFQQRTAREIQLRLQRLRWKLWRDRVIKWCFGR